MLFSHDDYCFYLGCLREGAARYDCSIHAYVLMTNHVHLLVTACRQEGLSRLMRYLGSRYVQHVNDVNRRTGTLWEGRFKSNLVDTEKYLLACYRYIELNPVRAHMVERPQDYLWSSCRWHAGGHKDCVVTDPVYLAVGLNHLERATAYRALLSDALNAELLSAIRDALNAGLVLGDEGFKDELGRIVARPVRPGRSGRPRKPTPMCEA